MLNMLAACKLSAVVLEVFGHMLWDWAAAELITLHCTS